MVNQHRGEILAVLDGREWTLCLTLGALADLETHFQVSDLGELAERLGSGRLNSADMLAILAAGLKGGGHSLSYEEISEMRNSQGATGFLSIIAQLLTATFGPVTQNHSTDCAD